MIWHADDLIERYRNRELDAASTASVDMHLLECARCRNLMRESEQPDAEDLWAVIVDAIDASPTSRSERLLTRLGIPARIARPLVATPGLAVATAVAAAVSLGLGVLFAHGSSSASFATFVALAAVAPSVGVAASFGSGVDPAYEIGAAAPLSGLRLVLVRTVAVVLVATVLGGIGALANLGEGWATIAWLLPSVALCLGTLALSTWVPPGHAAAALCATWLVGVATAGRLAGDWLAPFGLPTQVGAVLLAALSALTLLARAPRLDHREV